MSTYGKRGGEGPTRGKKSRTFEAVMPDGTVLRKRIFHSLTGDPYAYAYQHGGKWYIAAIREDGWEGGYSQKIAAREVAP